MTFYQWLKRQCDRDSIVGDFAKDVVNDKNRPKNSIRKTWITYLTSKQSCDCALLACHRAFDEWEELF
jgi:uncharacterized protein YozE (UPF0346 family)